MFRIIFVMDVFNGIVVHAVRGERASYTPVKSMVCSTHDPLDMIGWIKPGEVYMADLNRLRGMGDNFQVIRKVSGLCRTMADTGIRNMGDVERTLSVSQVAVLGTETASIDLIGEAAARFPGRITASIDIKDGQMLNREMTAEEIAEIFNGFALNDIIVLDLSRVGTGIGVNFELLRRIVGISDHSILAGGGVRGMEDIRLLENTRVAGALVATAVHNGAIPVEMLR
ncbi:MAG TPA: phosphoribosylformimino-5-aminoimidazole carboxamide ribotide isomerase [Candidatus Methanoperedenaceae archaeon]|nr:phosphoribosylformimino-5-aminoimidazole carboxamide ribotide isomerase [Candidatus Methanoperedenaceae archaeon]